MTTTDTPTQTPFETELNRLQETELRRFAEQAEVDYAQTVQAFINRLAEEDPSYVLQWNGESLLAAEVARKLGRYVLHVLEKGRTPAEAAQAGADFVQSVVNEGVSSSWSGYLTNEVNRTKARAALDMQAYGYWTSTLVGARYQAMYAVVSNQPVILAQAAVNGLQSKYDRARSEESRQKLNAQLTVAKNQLLVAQTEYRLAARDVGVPEDMIS